MVSRLQIIGEASRHLSEKFRDRHSEIPWRLVIGMRHHLVHGYFDVDPDIVWAAITERIPELKAHIDVAMATDSSLRAER